MESAFRSIGLVAMLAGIALCRTASAQWTVINLHPDGATASQAWGVDGEQQAGGATVDGVPRAGIWSGTAASWVDLRPAGDPYSYAFGASGGQQVGRAFEHAALWSGSAASWVDLAPVGTGSSLARGVGDGQQVGYAYVGSTYHYHASLWSGSAASWVDLNPAGMNRSQAYGVSCGQQVGVAEDGGNIEHASLWSGTHASWVDLHPAGAMASYATSISGGQQVGGASLGGGVYHASLWNGTAASWVDLNPAGATNSSAEGVSGGLQVGTAYVGGINRASLWNGTAASWVDLHQFLTSDFSASEARGIRHDATGVYVVGIAWTTSGYPRAVMWINPSCDTTITEQPQSVALIPNSTAAFSIGVSGNVASYQWRKDGSPLSNGGRIGGADSSTLTITSVQSADQGNYECVITGPCEVITSNAAELSCRPIITEQPLPTAVLRAGLQLSVNVPTGAPYTYRWRQNGQNLFNIAGLFAGVTTRTLTLLAVDPSLTGTYDCVLSDSCGNTESSSTEVYCPADFDQDGFISGPDFDAFVEAFEAGDVAADFDSDGFITGVDFDLYVQAFEAGC